MEEGLRGVSRVCPLPSVNPDDRRRGRKKATLLHTVENSFSFKFALAADLTGNRSSVERGLKGIDEMEGEKRKTRIVLFSIRERISKNEKNL